KQALGNEKYLEYLTKYPDSIEYYKFFVENGFRISKKEYVSEEKLTNAQKISIPQEWIENNNNINFEKFNILMLRLQQNENEEKYFLIKNTDLVLILKSKTDNEKKFKAKK
ncbi:MAG: hypothetical protein N3A01_09500, partial [Bacteroidales bacterium]|nr:hypothetical protein [Bacteroidales bacterium]